MSKNEPFLTKLKTMLDLLYLPASYLDHNKTFFVGPINLEIVIHMYQ